MKPDYSTTNRFGPNLRHQHHSGLIQIAFMLPHLSTATAVEYNGCKNLKVHPRSDDCLTLRREQITSEMCILLAKSPVDRMAMRYEEWLNCVRTGNIAP